MYKPRYGNYEHWALYLDEASEEKKTIFEVVGKHPDFKPHVLEADPEKSIRHKRNILVGTINSGDVPALKSHIEALPIDNETLDWNCQDYVIEAIDKLHEECIIDEDDKDYKKGRKTAVDKHFGPQ